MSPRSILTGSFARTVVFPSTLAIAGILAGCGSDSKAAHPLTAEQFAARNGVTLDGGPAQGQPVDRAGAVQYDSPERNPALATPPGPAPRSPAGAEENPNPENANSDPRARDVNTAISQAVNRPYSEQGIDKGKPGATGAAAPERIDLNDPAGVHPATMPGGQAADIFFVVMEVNSRPIFSDKVLQTLEKPLAVEAKKRNREDFKQLAAQLIQRQVQLLKLDELEVAAAEKALSEDDKKMAQALTIQWRMKAITESGGSLEIARRRAARDGWDFDEQVNQQYRVNLVQLYYRNHLSPLVQVSAADLRAYYNRNKDTEFSKPGRVKFRLIMIDPTSRVSSQAASDAADDVLKRAKKEDFSQLASDPKINDNLSTRERGGFVSEDGWVQIGSYRYPEVEKAVQSLRPGQVTDVIQTGGKLFIAKVEANEDAQVLPFEDPQVQDKIAQKLRNQQIQAMREQHVRELEEKAVAVRKPGALMSLLEIVMQRYPEWSGKEPAKGG